MSTYPKADAKTQWWDDNYGWDVIVPNVMVWHTTETMGWPGYGDGAKAPHITAKPNIGSKTMAFRQHFATEHSSRALVNLAGGVATNTNNAFQIELIGTCDDKYASTWVSGGRTYRAGVDYIHWPTAPDWALKQLADLCVYLATKFKVPLTCGVQWSAFKSPGGLAKNVRLSGSAFQKYTGHLGHQHVPENSHGDPGNFGAAMTKILAYAKQQMNPPAPAPAPVPVAAATTVVMTTQPKSVASLSELTLVATVTPKVAGTVQFQWYSGGTWKNVGAAAPVVNGVATIKNKPASTVIYRAIFSPTDRTKYKVDYSPNVTVPVIDLAALLARVEKLEGK